MHASVVRKGFTLAFKGFISSMAPIAPAISVVNKKLNNNSVFLGIRATPMSVLIINVTNIAMPPISGITGRSFLWTSRPTIPFSLINLMTIGKIRKHEVKLAINRISSLIIGIRFYPLSSSLKRKAQE